MTVYRRFKLIYFYQNQRSSTLVRMSVPCVVNRRLFLNWVKIKTGSPIAIVASDLEFSFNGRQDKSVLCLYNMTGCDVMFGAHACHSSVAAVPKSGHYDPCYKRALSRYHYKGDSSPNKQISNFIKKVNVCDFSNSIRF